LARKVRRSPGGEQDSGKYVYCVIGSTGEKESFGEIGYEGELVYTLDYRDFSPVVSDSPYKEYGMDESEVEIHRNVIQKGPSSGVSRFIEILEEVERSGISGKSFAGEMEGPFGSRAEYDIVIRSGFDLYRRKSSRRQGSIASGD